MRRSANNNENGVGRAPGGIVATTQIHLGPLGSANPFQVGYALFRITLGVNIFFHGFMRLITDLGAWEASQAALFTETFLPMPLVHAFLYALPFIEVFLGIFTVLGLLTHWALIGGSLMMLILLFGNTARQEWGTAGNNMHYVLYYYVLIVRLGDNWLALDNRRANAG
jgi:thiosulfate dehydrogenase [quinone] large subunit